jgi:hypothetical protein
VDKVALRMKTDKAFKKVVISTMKYCKNLGKCHMYPQYSNNKNKIRKKFLKNKVHRTGLVF